MTKGKIQDTQVMCYIRNYNSGAKAMEYGAKNSFSYLAKYKTKEKRRGVRRGSE
jgi:hypothetical protein